MNERFLQHLSVVTVIHVAGVALLVFATFFQGCFFSHSDKNEPMEFVVDVIPTQEGPAGKEAEAVLPQPEPEPEPEPVPELKPTMALEPLKKPEKKPDKQPKKEPEKKLATSSDKSKKEPIKISTAKVVRDKTVVRDKNKGQFSHYNPLSAKEIERLLALGAKPSTHTVIPGEDQRQKLLVKNMLYDNWVPPSKADAGRALATVRLWFGDGGRITKWQMERKSNVPVLDDSVTRLLESVRQVPELSRDFINQYRLQGFDVDFTVEE